jgi:hypothetical protein
MVAHHDVAKADRDSNPASTLDLGATDFDGMVMSEIFLDRRCKPRRHNVEIDRAGAKPQPERAERRTENNGE